MVSKLTLRHVPRLCTTICILDYKPNIFLCNFMWCMMTGSQPHMLIVPSHFLPGRIFSFTIASRSHCFPWTVLSLSLMKKGTTIWQAPHTSSEGASMLPPQLIPWITTSFGATNFNNKTIHSGWVHHPTQLTSEFDTQSTSHKSPPSMPFSHTPTTPEEQISRTSSDMQTKKKKKKQPWNQEEQ